MTIKNNKVFGVILVIIVIILLIIVSVLIINDNTTTIESDTTDACEESIETFKEVTESMDKPVIYLYPAAKPVIYLYPEHLLNVLVELDFDGELTYTYPVYNNGWKVKVSPDGTIIDENGREYNYLFWEGIPYTNNMEFSTGFCVKGEDTLEFLEKSLTKLGLNDKEQCDFITYWLPKMQDNKYNIISFQGDNYREVAKLKTTPAVETEIRVFMAWKPSDVEVNIEKQELTYTERKGFTLVEWGGSQVE